jgi:hypothetical protein
MSCVGSLGSGSGFGVSAVGGRVGVGEAVDDELTQLVSRNAATNKAYILFIVISVDKYT